MMMNKSKIEWCDFTWNPVTGCRHGCTYCYAAKQAARFCGNVMINKASGQLQSAGEGLWVLDQAFHNEIGRVTPFPVKFEPVLHTYRLPMPAQKKKPAVIFVVSMGDLFGEWVPGEWIEQVFAAADAAPWHTYLFLTKNPDRYLKLTEAGKLPERKNFWYGTTVTKPEQSFTWFTPGTYNWFLSIEPMQADFGRFNDAEGYFPEWVIVGAETGQQKNKVIPQERWIEKLISEVRRYDAKIFMKDNLAPYWGGKLIQEFPFDYPLKAGKNVDK